MNGVKNVNYEESSDVEDDIVREIPIRISKPTIQKNMQTTIKFVAPQPSHNADNAELYKAKSIDSSSNESPTSFFPKQRRKSEAEKYGELAITKQESITQVENLLKVTELAQNRESRIGELQRENAALRRQMEQLTNSGRAGKEWTEDLRADWAARDMLEGGGVDDHSQLVSDLVAARAALETDNQCLQTRAAQAEERLKHLEEGGLGDEARSKAQLLTALRASMDERVQWKEYARQLTLRAMEHSPALLEHNETAAAQLMSTDTQ